MSFMLSHVRMLSRLARVSNDMRVREFAIRLSEYIFDFQLCMLYDMEIYEFRCKGFVCVSVCLVHVQFDVSKYAFSVVLSYAHTLSIFFLRQPPFTLFSLDTRSLGHAVSLISKIYIHFERAQYNAYAQAHTPCNIWIALPFAHIHYVMIKQQTGIEI